MVGYARPAPAPSIDKTRFFQKPVFGLQLERCPPSDTSFSFKFWKELQRSVPSDIGRVSSNQLRSIFCARYGSFTKLQVNFQMSVHDHRHRQAHTSHLHSHPGRGGWSQHERWEGRHRVEHPGHTLISGFINIITVILQLIIITTGTEWNILPPPGPADLRGSFLSTSSSDESDEREDPIIAVRET